MTKNPSTPGAHNGRFIKRDELLVPLPRRTGSGKFNHCFEPEHIDVINTAIACKRPLLLTGDPGVGKSELARAAAQALGYAYIRYTVDAKTEANDLLWHFDAVARLADAQVAQAMGWTAEQCAMKLAPERYLRPGPLWWAFDWNGAKGRAEPPAQQNKEADPDKGVVVLIDEIDKAEIDVPHGLLEPLGDGSFEPPGLGRPVRIAGQHPLIVITSNGERGLPAAFLRRCVGFKMVLPEDPVELRRLLLQRGEAHTSLPEELLLRAVERFVTKDQKNEAALQRYKPGQAEFLDLLYAIEELSDSEYSEEDLFNMTKAYILLKGQAL